jgi:Ca2+-transporting ATPase
MMVIAVGAHSFYGTSMMALRVEPKATPLQEKLEHLANKIGKAGMYYAIFTFFVLFIKLMIVAAVNDEFNSEIGSKVVRIIIVCITIVVVAVPEGLPLAVTISLAYSMVLRRR